ncbi:MAG: DNA-protecting protein DprA [candidate division Zixibacteria bacterium]|nr:DNA-protecting protein DprA [candidate division Zixibacteria bacterium]
MLPGIGEIRFRKLLENFGTAEAVFEASEEDILQTGYIGARQANTIKKGYDNQIIDSLFATLEKEEIKIVNFQDADYPRNLKNIYDCPPILFYRGDISRLNMPSVAIVGSRKASGYGKSMSRKITQELVEAGFAIISGFARGIDTIAHKTAVENGGFTAAVMGCGLDRIYPPENKDLFGQLCEKGCLISEFFPGTPPVGGNFPKRNRVLSGLSHGVAVIEAAYRSGALSTARHALEQGRGVFAVPGPADSPYSDGTNNLIKSGAKLTTCAQDIIEELHNQIDIPLVSKSEKKTMEKLSGQQKQIYECLDSTGLHVDKIAKKVESDIPNVLNNLLEMELMGYIRALPGQRYARV